MVGQPKHGRKIAFSAIALTMVRNNNFGYPVFSSLQNSLDGVLTETNFFRGQPFSWIGLAVRYGLKNDSEPEFIHIDEKDGELALAIEIDVNETTGASLDEMKVIIGRAVLVSVIHAGEKYGCPVEALKQMLDHI